jgi:uncharacterized membrane protein YkvA (DUF1232 family)
MSENSLKAKISNMTKEVHALFLASKDSSVPWYAKAVMALIIGYVICPIDPIPDFISVLGELDELVVVPLGVALVVRMIPKGVMEDCRRRAREEPVDSRTKWLILAVAIVFWVFIAYLAWSYFAPYFFT